VVWWTWFGWNGLWRATPFQPTRVVFTHHGDLGLRETRWRMGMSGIKTN